MSSYTANKMAGYQTKVSWNRADAKFTDNRYSRAHVWEFDGGVTVPASSSPHVVREPYSVAANVDPEEALVVALSSCHMLSFLYVAAKQKYVVDQYRDQAEGVMGKNDAGKEYMTRVTLHPHVVFSGNRLPGDAEIEALHHQAHEECYIANSVKTVVETCGTWEAVS